MLKWYNGYNKNFYTSSNGDCANFVSQCMNAAGLPMISSRKCKKKGNVKAWISRTLGRGWSFGYDYTKSWGYAESHYEYFKKSSIVYRTYTIYNKDQINNNIDKWGIRPGDIVYYFKKQKDTKAHHVAIVSRIKGPNSPLEVAQHSDNYKDRDTRVQLKLEHKIVILRLKDNINFLKWN